MTTRVDDALRLVGMMSRAGSVTDLAGLFERAIQPFGCKTYSTWALANPERFHPSLGLISNWPDEWTDIYIRTKGYLVDPVVSTALTFSGGFHWRDISDIGSAAGHELFQNARQFGLADGFSIPIANGQGRPSIVNVSGQSFQWDDLEQGVMSLVASTFAMRLLYLRDMGISPKVAGLSRQEKAILYHAAVGRPDKVIAHELGLSTCTVQTYWRAVRRKLHAQDRAHAVAIGIWSGQIAP